MPTERNKAAKASAVPVQATGDVVTVVAISLVAEMIGDVLHEGLGHAAAALLTGAKPGEEPTREADVRGTRATKPRESQILDSSGLMCAVLNRHVR